MSVIITWLIRAIGIGGIAFLGLWIYDWGIPGASRIPYLSSIPILGDLTTGRAHSYAADQVKLATSNMVTKFERDTIAAQLAEEQRRTREAALISEEYRKRAEAAQQANAAAQDKLEKAIAEDNGTDSPVWDDRDFEWLCQHGSKAPQCGR